jgi:hemerythrin-like domain-containing protein
MPRCLFSKENWFPRFIIIKREQGTSAGGENTNEWYGFVAQMKRHLETETKKLKEFINRSTDKNKKEMKSGQEEMKKDVAEVKCDVAEVKA